MAVNSSPQVGIATQDLSGRTLGQYLITERIGSGGMSVVYRAVQASLGRDLALKVLSPALVHQEGFVQRFEQEARTLARLDHPYILPIYDFATIDGYTFIVSPLVRGGTLRGQLTGGPMAPQSALRYLNQVADALHHAHQVGVIHRDMKPSNVLIHADGRCVLADFGLARSADGPAGLTMGGVALGTPGYMPPEQALGSTLSPRADIYALGVIAFELLTGARPYPGTDPHKLVMATLHEAIPSAQERNPLLPAAAEEVLRKVLAKNPEDRYSSAVEFVVELSTSLLGSYTAVTPGPLPVPAAPLQHVGPHTPLPSRGTPLSSPSNPTVSTLEHMGIKRPRAASTRLQNRFFADALNAAEHVAGDHWMEMLRTAGLEAFQYDSPPEDDELGTPVDNLARLGEGIESIFGTQSPEQLRSWGRLVMEQDLEQDRNIGSERRALRILRGQKRVAAVLKGFTRRLDQVRGEPLHNWKQLDAEQFWVVIYANALLGGRQRAEKSCHFWTAALEARLRWAGLANEWTVTELECGGMNGGSDCVFAVRNARSI